MGELRTLDPLSPDPELLDLAAGWLGRGRVIGAPSDTVYGLLASTKSSGALQELQGMKSRPGPFLRLAAGLDQVRAACPELEAPLVRALEAVWPGAVTVVLPAPGVPEGLAFRVPDSGWLLDLMHRVGHSLWSTSANPRGEPEPLTAVEVATWFPGLPLVLDGGEARSRKTSTLVDARVWPGRVLRYGRGDPNPLLRPH